MKQSEKKKQTFYGNHRYVPGSRTGHSFCPTRKTERYHLAILADSSGGRIPRNWRNHLQYGSSRWWYVVNVLSSSVTLLHRRLPTLDHWRRTTVPSHRSNWIPDQSFGQVIQDWPRYHHLRCYGRLLPRCYGVGYGCHQCRDMILLHRWRGCYHHLPWIRSNSRHRRCRWPSDEWRPG